MARMTFKAGEDFMIALSKLSAGTEQIATKAIYAGASIMADKIRDNLEKLPEDTFRFLEDDEKFTGVPKGQKKDLLDSLGITPIEIDKNGNYNAKVGFDGYGTFPTKKYPKGVPNQLIARSVESGSEVRQKTPFVRPAVNAVRSQVTETMNQTITEEIKKLGI